MRILKIVNVLVLVVGIAAVCITGVRTNASIWGEKNPDTFLADSEDVMFTLRDSDSEYFADDIKSYDDLEQASNFIVRAEITSLREMSLYSTETKVVIKEVLKDREGVLKEGMEIYYVEPCSFIRNEIFDSGGYNYVKTDEEYILFLNRLVCPEGYKYTDKEAISFMPSANLFSRYCLTKTETAEALVEKDEYLYADYQDYALLTDDADKVDVYKDICDYVTK